MGLELDSTGEFSLKSPGKRLTPIQSLNVSRATLAESFWLDDETSVLNDIEDEEAPRIKVQRMQVMPSRVYPDLPWKALEVAKEPLVAPSNLQQLRWTGKPASVWARSEDSSLMQIEEPAFGKLGDTQDILKIDTSDFLQTACSSATTSDIKTVKN
jgi:hypothetical protein